MTTGWQRAFLAANRDTHWEEKCLKEDLEAGLPELIGQSAFRLACRYQLSERKAKRILKEKI